MLDMETKMKIAAVVLGAKDVTQLRGEIERTQKAAGKPAPDFTSNMRSGAAQTRGIISELGRELVAFASGAAILNFARTSVQEFAKAESSFRGLESVANASGFGIASALHQAEKLAADGLISVAESAKALQNLLARGYSLDQAVSTLERLKDSAAFNRAAQLSLGEAVVTASEGLKNENSILVDNAGVTKNVAKMWDDYAAKLGVTTNSLTQQQKIEAEYQGIMAETQAQLGNAQKALAGYQGEMAKANQETLKFKQTLGELLAPATIALAKFGNGFLSVLKLIVVGSAGAAIGLGFLGKAIGILLTAPFKEIPGALSRELDAARGAYDEFGRHVLDQKLEITKGLSGGADAQKIADNALKRAATNGEEQKKLTNDRIKDYEKLRDAIRKAWDDSIEAERNYLKEAKQLRAEANAFDPKSLAGASPQTVATKEISLRGDLRINEDRLRRKVSEGAPIEDIREQAQVVQDLAEQYRSLTGAVEEDTDKAAIAQRADEAVKASKIGLADALEQAAGEENQRQKDQQQLLVDLEKTLAGLENPRTVNVVTEQAKTAIAEVSTAMDQVKDKTVTITVRKIDAANAANFTGAYDSKGNALYRDPRRGGATGSYATGGLIRGPGHDTSDNLLAWLSPGEFVVQAAAVRKYGLDRFAAMNAMHLPKFSTGGAVSRMSLPSLPSGALGGIGANTTINLTIPGVGTYRMQAARETANSLQRDINIEALKFGGVS